MTYNNGASRRHVLLPARAQVESFFGYDGCRESHMRFMLSVLFLVAGLMPLTSIAALYILVGHIHKITVLEESPV